MTSTTIRDPKNRTPGAQLLGQRWDDTSPVERKPANDPLQTTLINWRAPRTLSERLRDAWAEFWA